MNGCSLSSPAHVFEVKETHIRRFAVRRVIQFSTIVLLLACSIYAFASGFDYTKEDLSGYNQPNFRVQNEFPDSRDGDSVYFFGGYVYTDRFLATGNKTMVDSINGFRFPYTPKTIFPAAFHGLEIGIGKELTRYINIEIAYNQQFVEKKSGSVNGVPFSTSVKMNGLLTDIGFVFNPDDAFQLMAKLGIQLSQFTNSLSFATFPADTFNDSTKLDPAIGLELLWQFNPAVGLRIDTMYVAETQGANSSGEANIMAGLNYTL